MNSSIEQLRELKRNRNIVRIVVVVGISASIAANTLGAESFVNALIAGWPPVALLLTIEILTRVPASKRLGAFGRIMAALGVAAGAGWLSYWHMAATVSQHGESGSSAYVWPISVDGLMTVAAIALVELGNRIRLVETAHQEHQARMEAIVPQPPAAVVPQSPAVSPQLVAAVEQAMAPAPSPMRAPRAVAPQRARTLAPFKSPLTDRMIGG